jgi:ubiquitin-conjugating enzyme E2 D/E
MGAGFSEMRAWCDDGNQNALDKTLEKRSRMDAVKQVFYAFRDRTETLGVGKHQLGLVQFDSSVETLLGLTSSLDLFEAIVDDVEKRGSTAIYSAISEACRMLRPVFDDQPQADLRVLVLTDGQNNTGASPEMALSDCNAIGAVVDAIIVGDTPDTNLRKIVTATGGSCFRIARLSEGFELMESEAVVSLRARRGGGDKPPFSERPWPEGGFGRVRAQTITSAASASTIVARTAAVAKKMISCQVLVQKAGGKGGAAVAAASGSAAKKRIMHELAEVAKGSKKVWLVSGEGIHLFPDADNMHLMKALIEGPAGTPFEGGVFALNVRVPASYPFGAPTLSFETPIYHCNVSDTGRICMKMLESEWSPVLSIPKALEAVRNLMAHPDTANALRQWIAELTLMYTRSGGADSRYADAARAATKANAKRSVYGWKVEWGLAADDKE